MVYMQILHPFYIRDLSVTDFGICRKVLEPTSVRPRETAVYAKERSKRKWHFLGATSNSIWLGHRLKKEQKEKDRAKIMKSFVCRA